MTELQKAKIEKLIDEVAAKLDEIDSRKDPRVFDALQDEYDEVEKYYLEQLKAIKNENPNG